jgi:L-ascorbate metabolism protein UlaG (beta-lactamase superfamily)
VGAAETSVGTRNAALAAGLPGVEDVVPIHYGTFPILAGTPAELRTALDERGLRDVQVHGPEPGGRVS